MVLDVIQKENLDLVINIPRNFRVEELNNDYKVRRKAIDFAIPLITNVQLAKSLIDALSEKKLEDLKIEDWNNY